MPSIEEMQAQLAAKIAKLDEERRANAAKHAKEREEMLLEVEMERQKRTAEYTAKVAEHERRRKAEKEAEEAQRIRDIAERISTEQKQHALDEALKLQRETLEWLEKAISEAELHEERYKKESESIIVQPVSADVYEVNVEHPVAPVSAIEPGGAVEGTGGAEEYSTMSGHLKQILRQAQRS